MPKCSVALVTLVVVAEWTALGCATMNKTTVVEASDTAAPLGADATADVQRTDARPDPHAEACRKSLPCSRVKRSEKAPGMSRTPRFVTRRGPDWRLRSRDGARPASVRNRWRADLAWLPT